MFDLIMVPLRIALLPITVPLSLVTLPVRLPLNLLALPITLSLDILQNFGGYFWTTIATTAAYENYMAGFQAQAPSPDKGKPGLAGGIFKGFRGRAARSTMIS